VQEFFGLRIVLESSHWMRFKRSFKSLLFFVSIDHKSKNEVEVAVYGLLK
jgi:hypothetical protein